MKQGRHALIYGLLLSVAWMASCSKSEAPPAPKSEPPKAAAPEVNADMKRLAAEVYVYAYPLVVTDVIRQVDTANAPPNAFQQRRAVPDASTVDVVSPNADFLYSEAWLDLSKEPVILSVPDTRGRYYLIAMIDAWTNVAASLGKRTTGTEKREFAIVGPRWKGTLPVEVTEIKSPTETAWLLGRTEVKSKADRAAAALIQNQFTLMPLSQRGKRGAKAAAAPATPPGGPDIKTEPREQVARMDPTTFFTRFAKLLPANPPAKDDAPMLEKMRKLGIVAGQPFDLGKLDPVSIRSVEQGATSTQNAIVSAAKGIGSADIKNGWTVDRALGRWGTDYGRRAVATIANGLGVNAPEDAIFMAARFDAQGHRLEGTSRYVLHFDKDNLPPADAFWSLSLYNDQQHFATNALNRYNIGNNDGGLKANADGSLDIYIQNTDPGKDKEPNWLPAPTGAFNLILRIYWPKQDVIDGRWTAPGIRRAAS